MRNDLIPMSVAEPGVVVTGLMLVNFSEGG